MKTCCICNEKRMFEITQIYSIPELLSFANEEHICSRCWEAIMCLVYLRKQDPEHFRQGYPAFFHQKNKVDYIAGKVNGIQNLELRAAIQSRHAEIMALYDEYSIEGEAKLKGEVEARQALRTARWNDFLANHPEFASTRKTIQVEKRLYHRKTIESAWNFDGLGRFTFFLDFGIDSGYLYFGDNDQKNPGEFSIGVSGLKARIAEIDKELKKKRTTMNYSESSASASIPSFFSGRLEMFSIPQKSAAGVAAVAA